MIVRLYSLEWWIYCDNMLLAWRTHYTRGVALNILEGEIAPYMALGCLNDCMEDWSQFMDSLVVTMIM
jgi:hypothetical protein